MIAPPLVSVIIPAYNAEAFIAETLESILAQTYPHLEIIVVDDGSTDQTARIVRRYGGSVRYSHQANSGGCAVPRNAGIARSTGDLLCFNDADDLMVQDRIEAQVDFMMRHPNVMLVFSNYRNFNETGHSAQSHFEDCPVFRTHMGSREEIVIENACPYLARENFGIASSFLMHRGLLEKESCFEPTLKSCEDFHFYYRLARHTPVGAINKVGTLRRFHGDNMSSNLEKMRFEGIRSYSMLQAGESDPFARKLLGEYIALCRADLARFNANRSNYGRALRQYAAAVRTDPRPAQLARSLRGAARTALMAIGVHKPDE